MSYSQNREDEFVLNYFIERYLISNYKGTLLEIGANDGKTFSNSRLLIENGWSAELIEPGEVFEDLIYLYPAEQYPQVEMAKLAIGDKNDTIAFFNSGAHVVGGKDKGLVSTADPGEMSRWPGVDFKISPIQMVTWAEYLKTFSVNKKFDFISIDAEGQDAIILQQMDLTALDCRCICIEHNSDPKLLQLFTDYCGKFGMREAVRNAENLIFVR